jgi:hypothetical protein
VDFESESFEKAEANLEMVDLTKPSN